MRRFLSILGLFLFLTAAGCASENETEDKITLPPQVVTSDDAVQNIPEPTVSPVLEVAAELYDSEDPSSIIGVISNIKLIKTENNWRRTVEDYAAIKDFYDAIQGGTETVPDDYILDGGTVYTLEIYFVDGETETVDLFNEKIFSVNDKYYRADTKDLVSLSRYCWLENSTSNWGLGSSCVNDTVISYEDHWAVVEPQESELIRKYYDKLSFSTELMDEYDAKPGDAVTLICRGEISQDTVHEVEIVGWALADQP